MNDQMIRPRIVPEIGILYAMIYQEVKNLVPEEYLVPLGEKLDLLSRGELQHLLLAVRDRRHEMHEQITAMLSLEAEMPSTAAEMPTAPVYDAVLDIDEIDPACWHIDSEDHRDERDAERREDARLREIVDKIGCDRVRTYVRSEPWSSSAFAVYSE